MPRHPLWRVFFGYLLPLMFLSIAGESMGLLKFGMWEGDFAPRLVKPSQELLIRYQTVQTILDLFIVFGGAWLLKVLGESFHRKHSYSECFAALGYSLGPFFLVRLLDAFPGINTWIPYAFGILLTVSALYKGIPRVMKPDPSNALGLYLMSSLLIIGITAPAHFFAAAVLEQKTLAHGFHF